LAIYLNYIAKEHLEGIVFLYLKYSTYGVYYLPMNFAVPSLDTPEMKPTA
jgi:hypothetical protein